MRFQELHPSFQPFPTYPIILPFKHTSLDVIDFYARSASSAASIPGVPKLDTRRVVDGERKIEFVKRLPVTSEEGGKKFEVKSRVLGVYDKGKPGTVVETVQELVDGDGEVYARMVGSAFYVGQGGWGGPKGRWTPFSSVASFAAGLVCVVAWGTCSLIYSPHVKQVRRRSTSRLQKVRSRMQLWSTKLHPPQRISTG